VKKEKGPTWLEGNQTTSFQCDRAAAGRQGFQEIFAVILRLLPRWRGILGQFYCQIAAEIGIGGSSRQL
jgi:hypothetical protein